jgi:hypothetical protein
MVRESINGQDVEVIVYGEDSRVAESPLTAREKVIHPGSGRCCIAGEGRIQIGLSRRKA